MDPLMDPAAAVWPPPPPPSQPLPQPPVVQPLQPYPFQAPAYPASPFLVENNIHIQSQNHPAYPEMIIAAITALKEREGSSRQAIAKYIQSVYTNLPPNHPTLLTYHLKKMKNEGALAMVKHSYALPGSVYVPPSVAIDSNPNLNVPLSPSTGPKRGPGRPPKAKNLEQAPPVAAMEQPNVGVGVGPVFGPGDGVAGPLLVQPNDGVGTEKMLVSLGLVDGPASPVAKRGRGRPPKDKATLGVGGPAAPPAAVEKKGRGRPPRAERVAGHAPGSVPGVAAVLRPAGRRGRPPKKVALPGGRPRGRPPKVSVAAAGAAIEGGIMPAKRRGRPPRAGGPLKKPGRLSGKPLGRPKKNNSVAVDEVAAQQLVAYQDLKNKLEHFQARVKQAVEVVKPYFNEAAPFAVGALQELEELASMDMTALVQAPPQAQPQQLDVQS